MEFSAQTLKNLFLDLLSKITQLAREASKNNPGLDNQFAVVIESVNQTVQPLFEAEGGEDGSIGANTQQKMLDLICKYRELRSKSLELENAIARRDGFLMGLSSLMGDFSEDIETLISYAPWIVAKRITEHFVKICDRPTLEEIVESREDELCEEGYQEIADELKELEGIRQKLDKREQHLELSEVENQQYESQISALREETTTQEREIELMERLLQKNSLQPEDVWRKSCEDTTGKREFIQPSYCADNRCLEDAILEEIDEVSNSTTEMVIGDVKPEMLQVQQVTGREINENRQNRQSFKNSAESKEQRPETVPILQAKIKAEDFLLSQPESRIAAAEGKNNAEMRKSRPVSERIEQEYHEPPVQELFADKIKSKERNEPNGQKPDVSLTERNSADELYHNIQNRILQPWDELDSNGLENREVVGKGGKNDCLSDEEGGRVSVIARQLERLQRRLLEANSTIERLQLENNEIRGENNHLVTECQNTEQQLQIAVSRGYSLDKEADMYRSQQCDLEERLHEEETLIAELQRKQRQEKENNANKNAETSLIARANSQLEEQLCKGAEEIQKVRQELIAEKEATQILRSEHEVLENLAKQSELELEQRKPRCEEFERLLLNEQESNKILKEDNARESSVLARIEHELADEKASHADIDEKYRLLEANLRANENENNALRHELDDNTSHLETVLVELKEAYQRIEHLEKELKEEEGERSRVNEEMSQLGNELQALAETNSKLNVIMQDEQRKAQADQQFANEEIKDAKEQVERLHSLLEQAQQSHGQLHRENSTLLEKMKKLGEEYHEAECVLHEELHSSGSLSKEQFLELQTVKQEMLAEEDKYKKALQNMESRQHTVEQQLGIAQANAERADELQHRNEELEEECKTVAENCEDSEREAMELRRAMESVEEENNHLKNQTTLAESENSDLNEQIRKLSQELEAIQSAHQLVNSDLRNEQEKADDAMRELEQKDMMLESRERECQQLKHEMDKLQWSQEVLENELQLSEGTADELLSSRIQQEDMRSELSQSEAQAEKLREELQSLAKSSEAYQSEIESLKSRNAELSDRVLCTSQEFESAAANVEATTMSNEKLKVQVDALQKELKDTRQRESEALQHLQTIMQKEARESVSEADTHGTTMARPSRRPEIRPVHLRVGQNAERLDVQDDCQFFTLKNYLLNREKAGDRYASFELNGNELQNDFLVRDVVTSEEKPITCAFHAYKLGGGDIPIRVEFLNYSQKRGETYYVQRSTTALEFVQFLARVENFSEIKSISADKYFELVITNNIEDNVDEKYDLDWPILEFPGFQQSQVLRLKTDCLCQDAREWQLDPRGSIVRRVKEDE